MRGHESCLGRMGRGRWSVRSHLLSRVRIKPRIKTFLPTALRIPTSTSSPHFVASARALIARRRRETTQQTTMNGANGFYGPPPPAAATWQEYRSADGRVYYYNAATKETTWTKPEEMMSPAEVRFLPTGSPVFADLRASARSRTNHGRSTRRRVAASIGTTLRRSRVRGRCPRPIRRPSAHPGRRQPRQPRRESSTLRRLPRLPLTDVFQNSVGISVRRRRLRRWL